MNRDEALQQYATRMGDNAVVLAQRLSEWVGHGPELEEETLSQNYACTECSAGAM